MPNGDETAREEDGIDDTLPEEEETGPLRRSVATGQSLAKEALLRFVVGPDGELVPDFDQTLPGRGLYAEPDAGLITAALRKRAFQKAARRAIAVPEDLVTRLEGRIAGRAIDLIGLARRAGQVVMGYDQVSTRLKLGGVALLVQAADAAEQGRARLRAMAGDTPEISVLTAVELASPFGREHVVHVAISRGGIAKRLQNELYRLKGFRAGALNVESR